MLEPVDEENIFAMLEPIDEENSLMYSSFI